MKRGIRKSAVVLLVMIMVLAMPLTAYAATQTKNSTTKMSVALMRGTTGNTNTVNINFSTVGTVSKIKVSAPLLTHTGNAIVVNSFSWNTKLFQFHHDRNPFPPQRICRDPIGRNDQQAVAGNAHLRGTVLCAQLCIGGTHLIVGSGTTGRQGAGEYVLVL
jgi:hypothetical protein